MNKVLLITASCLGFVAGERRLERRRSARRRSLGWLRGAAGFLSAPLLSRLPSDRDGRADGGLPVASS